MKIVLRHKVTGKYYSSAGRWVRRADNALTFEDMSSARECQRVNHLKATEAVERLAPYLMRLLNHPEEAEQDAGLRLRASEWCEQMEKVSRN
jgi:hypothetical protein